MKFLSAYTAADRPGGKKRPGCGLTILLLSLLFPLCFSGCSVYLAAQGTPEPSLETIKVGSSRAEIEAELGSPVLREFHQDGGTREVYVYKVGDNPNFGRAFRNLLIDVLTLTLWELIATPVELAQGVEQALEVYYGPEGKAVELRKVSAPAGG